MPRRHSPLLLFLSFSHGQWARRLRFYGYFALNLPYTDIFLPATALRQEFWEEKLGAGVILGYSDINNYAKRSGKKSEILHLRPGKENMKKLKHIGLVAHDACKQEMTDWVEFNLHKLHPHKLYCTGTTGRLIEEMFERHGKPATVTRFKSGPLGGDQQMGALIAEERLDILFFFTDPMTMQPHDVDVKALLRISGIANIVIATNRSTADFVISSPLFDEAYQERKPDYDGYIKRILG